MSSNKFSQVGALLCLACLLLVSHEVRADDEEIEHPMVVVIDEGEDTYFKLTVEPSDTVRDLKRMISLHRTVYPVAIQRLFHTERDMELVDDKATLKSYGLEQGSIVRVLNKPTFDAALFKSNPKSTYFGVDANDKEAVRKRQEELSQEKFKDLFGDDAEDIHFHYSDEGSKIHESINNAFMWLYKKIAGEPEK